MYNLTEYKTIRALCEKYQFHPSKGKGQNFLINPDICPRMARLSGAGKGVGVLEIGPGFGVLSAELAKITEKVVSIELDERLRPILTETLADFKNIEVIYGDVLKIDLLQVIKTHFFGMKVVVCANLPYYITSPVIMYLLESKLPVESITVMVQKEAADRFCAQVGSRQSGAVTITVNYYSRPEVLFRVSRNSFYPSPRVDSAVIRLNILRYPTVEVTDEKFFFRVVKAAFGQRRKTILNALAGGLGIPKEEVARVLDQAGISQTARAERLYMDEYKKICEIFNKQIR